VRALCTTTVPNLLRTKLPPKMEAEAADLSAKGAEVKRKVAEDSEMYDDDEVRYPAARLPSCPAARAAPNRRSAWPRFCGVLVFPGG